MASTTGSAFGLRLRAGFPLPNLGPAAGERTVELRSAELGTAWQADGAERLLERWYAPGRLGMAVERDPGGSFLVDAPGHGRFLVEAGGGSVRCELPDVDPWRWQRPLYYQALPLAAMLNGLELLHASAVVLGDAAIALTGRAEAGKTTMAVHLAASGLPLLTDDVLAVEPVAGQVQAHRGPRIASIPPEQLDALPAPLGPELGRSEKAIVALPDDAQAALPLAAIYFVEHASNLGDVAIEPVIPPDPPLLLAAGFMSHVPDPARLARQLDACARIAESVPMFRALVPRGDLPPQEAAKRIREHAASAV